MVIPARRAARCGDTGSGKRMPSSSTRPPESRRTSAVSLVGSGLDRLPVATPRDSAASARPTAPSCRRPCRSRLRRDRAQGFHENFTKRSRISSERPTFTDIRSRAVPAGTVGGRIARTSNPASCKAAATATARSFSPMITGIIGESSSRNRQCPPPQAARAGIEPENGLAHGAPAPPRSHPGWRRAQRRSQVVRRSKI